MKMKKLGLVLTAIACMGMITACGSKDSAKGDSKGEEKKTLVMATNAEFPPYEYYEGDEIVGIDAEFAAAIAEKLGMELKIEDMAFNSILSAVSSGKADLGVAGMTVDETRKKQVDFSDSYYTGRQVIIVKEDSDIAGPDGLEGKKIGVQEGTTGDIYTTDDFGDEAIERYNKGMEAVQALAQGKIDAVVIDDQPAQTFVEQVEGLKVLEAEYAEEDYAIALKKGNTELLEKVNAAIKELKEDGTFDEIVAKYIK
ncbi:basic amino acid ABC transporter substrate-binding protein [Roseburia hominis]